MLWRFDTAPLCCVINKCQLRTNDKLEKCVHGVGLLYSICGKSTRGRHKSFVFIWKKLLPNHTDYFEKLMVNVLHRRIRVYSGIGVSKVMTLTRDKKEDEEHGKPTTKFVDVELRALLDEEDSQTQQQQLAEQLGVGYERWERFRRPVYGYHVCWTTGKEKSKKTCDILLARYNRKSFLHRIVAGDEKWIYFENPKRK